MVQIGKVLCFGVLFYFFFMDKENLFYAEV